LVLDPGSPAAANEGRDAPHGAEGAHGAVDAARHGPASPLEPAGRLGTAARFAHQSPSRPSPSPVTSAGGRMRCRAFRGEAMLLDLDPVMFQLGPLTVRWYGFFMAVSMAIGIYYFIKHGTGRGLPEDALYNAALVAIVLGVVGARLVYVATNWGDYAGNPVEIIRVDHGGLSFHGAVGGGMLALWYYARRAGLPFQSLLDLGVPGVCVGIMLVRIGNLFNGEVLGHVAQALPFDRHPAQIYGSLVGLVTLLIHNSLARRRPDAPPGYLFW